MLGRLQGDAPGPTLICVGAMHGNEPAGVHAIRRVVRRLADGDRLQAGAFVGLVGNRAALMRGSRFVDRDLNRAWTEERVRRLTANSSSATADEDTEQVEVLREIRRAIHEARGPVYLLDLHTTSGPGGIFSVFGDALPQRAFAASFPVPMVLGLEELVDGTIIQFFGERGLLAVTVETGKHDAPEAVERAEAAVWVALAALDMLAPDAREEAATGERLLRRASEGLPRALEMRHRHAVRPGDGFKMEPGYRNFDRVVRGTVIAGDSTGEISVPETARLLMPLYQDQGEDGFFLVRRFSPFWMWVSERLRAARVDRFAHRLPGIHRVPADPHAVVVDRRVARFFARQLFHLLGFRRVDESGDRLIMRRRPFDRPGGS
ncbi:MAG: succinylglutamate desuccinylase/aspartoacylase family protein [Gemmatimonadota bacterium]